MYRRLLLIMVIVLPILAFMAVGGASAACGDLPAAFVDWSGCVKDGEDLSGETLFAANLVGTSFVGANLSGADLRFALVTGADFTDADLSNALMSLVANANNISFAGANIQGLDLSNAVLENVDFTGSTGTPKLNSTTIATSTCPDGTASTATSPYCTWTPTAISLAALEGAAVSELWPAALFALLFAGTAGYLLTRRRRELAKIAV
jgi:uncharacterized protein YjbI with pentapeptide repeats